MSSSLRNRLRKVVMPAPSCILRVADSGMTSVAGICTARVGIGGHAVPVLLAVLNTCPYDVVIGLDFLADDAALIYCASGVLRIELPISPATDIKIQPQLRSTEHIRLAPKAVTYLPLTCSPPVPDGDYIVSPVADVLLDRNVTVPFSVVTVTQNLITLPFLNFGLSTQVLPQGIALALLSPLDDCEISAMTIDTAQDDKASYCNLKKSE